MHGSRKTLGLFVFIVWHGFSGAMASGGVWTFRLEERGHPELSYSENNKRVFYIGCGRAFGLHAVYPGVAKKVGDKATITIANSTNRMMFDGEIDENWDSDPPNTKHFRQWDLGYERQDPDLFGEKWKRLKLRFFDLLDSRQLLTISAEDRSYVLPAVNVPDWKTRFEKNC